MKKNEIDKEIEAALREYDEGRSLGPFRTAKQAIRVLHREARRIRKKEQRP